MSDDFNPKTEGEKISDAVAKLAVELHGDDRAAAKKLIEQIVVGDSIWATATRGLALCKYSLARARGQS